MGRILCFIGIHFWTVDVPAHAVTVLRSGRVIEDCAWCGKWRQAEGE